MTAQETDILTIETKKFGTVDVNKNAIFNFVSPIIGFNEHKNYTIIDYKPDSPFKWLQSMEDMDLAFPVTLCSYFNIDYQFELSDEDAQTLGVKSADEILAINIVTIPQINPQAATINLLAPIVINTTNNNAMQVILRDSKLPVRHPLFEKQEKKSDEGAK